MSTSLSRTRIGTFFIILPAWMVDIGVEFLVASISTRGAQKLRIPVIILALIPMVLAVPFVLLLLTLTGIGGPSSATLHSAFMLKAYGALIIYWLVLGLCAWSMYIAGRKSYLVAG